MLVRVVWRVLVSAACATFVAQVGNAQRFEGIITFKVSSLVGVERGGARAANAAGRAGEGRGADVRIAEGRGVAGRAGAAAGASGAPAATRSGEARPPSGRGEGQFTDAQAEAMRSALSTGLQHIEYMTRRGRVRIALGAAPGGQVAAAMIYVPDDGVMFTLLPAVSMYSETALADLVPLPTDQATTTVQTAVPPRPPVVTHTKKFELVAGHKCEHVVVEYAKQKTDICMGKGLGVFIMPSMMGRADAWTTVMSEANGFPLKVVQANGTVTMEVTKIERKALPEALFNVPDTYSRMPDMMRRPPG